MIIILIIDAGNGWPTPMIWSRLFAAVLLCSSMFGLPAHADEFAVQAKAKQIWQLLDYLSVDYAKSVKDGQVVSSTEYAEMQEFAQAAERQLAELPPSKTTPALLTGAATLRTAIAQKSPAATVADQARKLAGELLTSYPVPMAPARLPDTRLGGTLFQAQCAACHGATGHSDGPLAATLSPPPIVLADHSRAQERSVFAIQQILTHGVDGTAMPSFAKLSEQERWALAYFASTLAYSDAERQAGAKLWMNNTALRKAVPNLAALSSNSESALAKTVGTEVARPLTAYLRSTPETLQAAVTDTVPIAKSKLTESVAALDRADRLAASRLALSAYLDGFEPIEPALAAKDKPLFEEIEKSMGSYRVAVNAGRVEEAHALEQKLQVLLNSAQGALKSANDPWSTFIGAFTILMREGLEALLVVVAMIAFLKKADRRDVLPYVHGGWVAALAAGGLTWGIATYLVDLSGAGREMTEGFSAIFAAIVLLSVGIWMHQKSLAGRWQAYVKEKLSSALNKSSTTMLFVLSFVTVYREVFETVLFYAALWSDGNGVYMLAGLGAGVVVLVGIGIVLLRTSARLPISQFFAVSSALVAILATVLMGKGVAALQKVGFIGMTPLASPRIDLIGLYPSMQTILAQVAIVLIIVFSVIYNLRTQKIASPVKGGSLPS